MFAALFQSESAFADTARSVFAATTAVGRTRFAVVTVQILPFGAEFRQTHRFIGRKSDGATFALTAFHIQVFVRAANQRITFPAGRQHIIFFANLTAVFIASGAIRKFVETAFAVVAVQIFRTSAADGQTTVARFRQQRPCNALFARRSQFGTLRAIGKHVGTRFARQNVAVKSDGTFHLDTSAGTVGFKAQRFVANVAFSGGFASNASVRTRSARRFVVKQSFGAKVFDTFSVSPPEPHQSTFAFAVDKLCSPARAKHACFSVGTGLAVLQNIGAFGAFFTRQIFIRGAHNLLTAAVGLLDIAELTFVALLAVRRTNAATRSETGFAGFARIAVRIVIFGTFFTLFCIGANPAAG